MSLPMGEPVEVWGHKFHWTPEHKPASEIAHLLYSYDKLATDALGRLDEIDPPKSKSWKCPHGSGEGQRDLYTLVQKHAASDKLLGELWNEISTIPEWVDWEQIARGQRVVYQFNVHILFGLLYKSLLGGMGAWRVVETLSRTGGFGVKVTRRRLLETLQHFMEVIEDLDSIKPGGKGFVSSVRVRLLHAAVRRRLMQLEREKPGYFDIDKLGVPINDLHSMGTVSVYSTAIIYMALPRQGIHLTEQQTADYLALWRWTGYLLGSPVDWMATPAQAKIMMESVMTSEMAPSPNSSILANNILTAEARVPPLYAPRELLVAQAYQLNGDHLASALGIERPRWYYRLIIQIQCFLLMLLSYSYPWMPAWGQRDRDQKFRYVTRHMITSKSIGGLGEPSMFHFQYIPRLGKMTVLGSPQDLATENPSWSAPLTAMLMTNSKRWPSRAVLAVAALVGVVAVACLVSVTGSLRAVPHSFPWSLFEPQVLHGLG